MSATETKEKILKAATKLISQKGFDGVSLRDISRESGANLNSIRHHFGSKDDLLETVFQQFDHSVFSSPLRLIEDAPQNKEEFRLKFSLFLNEVFTQLMEQRELFRVVFHEGHRCKSVINYVPQQEKIISFIEEAQKKGIVSKSIQAKMISGVFMDRLMPQVLFADRIKESFGMDMTDPKFRKKWLHASLDLLFNGLFAREQ